MEESEVKEESTNQTSAISPKASIRPVADGPIAAPPSAPNPGSCPTCGTGGNAMPPSYVYTLGRIEPRFPRLSVEKEFAQATGRAETANLTDRRALHKVLQDNRYLVRQLCWVMMVGGLETYILVPRDPTDFHLLVES